VSGLSTAGKLPPQVERVEKSALSGDSLVDLVHVVLQNAVIAGESEELGQVPYAYCALVLDPQLSVRTRHHDQMQVQGT